MIAENSENDGEDGPFLDEIPFTVVSEPNDDDDDDDSSNKNTMETTTTGDECEDLGNASIRLKDILNRGKDAVDEELPVYAGDDVVGHLRVSVECLTTLKKVKSEMDAASSMSASSELTKDDLSLSKAKSLLQ